MTIAISLKVNDGVVLAADSAATIITNTGNNQPVGVINVYQNAEKVYNLCKGKPVGSITWGSGSIGQASISTLMKDFRKEKQDILSKEDFHVEEISHELSKFVYEDNFKPAYKTWPKNSRPRIGFMVSGYSAGDSFAEEWKFDIINGELKGPNKIRGKEQTGITWNGEPEALYRLILGISNGLTSVLQDCGVDDNLIKEILDKAQDKLTIPFVMSPMPIKDAIDLAEFFVQTTINFSKFSPGAPTVAGPIDIAAITKHEGFKWIYRKHYYNSDRNSIQ
jgi:hypothetical protein